MLAVQVALTKSHQDGGQPELRPAGKLKVVQVRRPSSRYGPIWHMGCWRAERPAPRQTLAAVPCVVLPVCRNGDIVTSDQAGLLAQVSDD